MKILLSFLTIALISLNGYAQKDIQGLLNAYLKVKDELIKSDSRQTTLQATDFLSVLENEKPFEQKESLVKATKKIVKSKDLEKQRTAFVDLSVIMWPIIKAAENLNENVYYQYCPMKKVYWMSNEAVIKNPYYGSKMLNCGNVADKKIN